MRAGAREEILPAAVEAGARFDGGGTAADSTRSSVA